MRYTATLILTILSTAALLGQTNKIRLAEKGSVNSGKWINTRYKTAYKIGGKDSVEFSNLSFTATKRTGDACIVFTNVKNLSDHEIAINVFEQKKLKVEPRTLLLKEKDSIQIYITTTIPAGQINEVIRLVTTEWDLNLELTGFGYQLSTTDFDTPDMKQIFGDLYYFRTGNEYQMEIVDYIEKPKHLPLSKQLVKIDLRKGTYVLTIVGPSGRKSKEITIE